MIYADVFAGCGGASRGLMAAGLQGALHLEREHEPCTTMRRWGAEHVVQADIRRVRAGSVLDRPVDLLWSSTPCQAWSLGGKRMGKADPRNGWPWLMAWIDAMQRAGLGPRWALTENVTGMVCHSRKAGCGKGADPKPDICPRCYFDHEVVPAFEDRFEHVSWRKISSADYGVPQKRVRVYLVAGPAPYAWPEPTHGIERLAHDKWVDGSYWERMSTARRGQPSRAERWALKRLERASEHESSAYLSRQPWTTLRQSLGAVLDTTQAWYLEGDGGEPGGVVRGPLTYSQMSHTEHVLIDPGAGQGSLSQRNRTLRPDEPSTTVDCGATKDSYRAPFVIVGGGHNPNDPSDGGRSYRDLTDEPCTTIAAQPGGGAGNAGPWVDQGQTRRRLLVEECALLQHLPFAIYGSTKRSRYGQVGNAVTPDVATALARSVVELEGWHV